MLSLRTVTLLGLGLAACSSDLGSVRLAGSTAAGDSCFCDDRVVLYLNHDAGKCDQCVVEKSELGKLGQAVTLGGVEVTFTRWIAKDGEPGEYVGFEFEANVPAAALGYNIATSASTRHVSGGAFTVPDGEVLASIDFCDPDGHPDDEGGGDEGTCTDPDGCPDDGGDGSCDDPDGCPEDPTGDDGGGTTVPCYCDPSGPDLGNCDDPDGCPEDSDGLPPVE